MLEKRAALISLSRQRPPPTPPNDPPWKNVFTDISLYDHFELPEHIFGNCHFGNVHEENWHLSPPWFFGKKTSFSVSVLVSVRNTIPNERP